MPTRLQDEIKQTKPFSSLEEEAALSIERTAAVVGHRIAEMLRPYNVTATQYNVLRILRGAGERGLCRHEVRDRLIAQVPDVTRLLDRMEDAGLVERERDETDRRLVNTRITRAGLRLLDELDAPITEFQRRELGHLSREKLRTLIDLLAEARNRA
ncbi:MAG TPA: MarR family transcriptional regulator [Gemmatimonadaceae bacterium]|nr:MarR family transcriptional regulator [Gemmatimonadaceae bacterium]